MDPILGTILLWTSSRIPEGYVLCNGQGLAISQYQALYSIIGLTYGGNSSTFNVPNLNGRTPIGTNPTAASGISVHALGQSGGVESQTLTVANMPAHTHVATFNASTAGMVATTTPGTTTTPAAGMIPAAINGAAVTAAIGSASNIYAYAAPDSHTVTMPGALSLNGGVVNQSTGGNAPTSVMQPFLALNYIICVNGIYPTFP